MAMMPYEKDLLLALLESDERWCQDVEARDLGGDPVKYNDATAVAWDITGALCRLFGWKRACMLFRQLDHHIHGRNRRLLSSWESELRAMAALQDFNDRAEMTHAALVQALRSWPVWSGASRQAARTTASEDSCRSEKNRPGMPEIASSGNGNVRIARKQP